MFKEDTGKSERQNEAINKWVTNYCSGTLNLIMGFGKTKVAFDVQTMVKSDNVISLAPSDIGCKNLIENGCKNVYSFTKFLNNDQLWKTYYDLIIIDEIHQIFKGDNARILDCVKGKFKLGLTGSELSFSQEQFLMSKGYPIVDKITEEEAISKGWLSSFIEYNVPIAIDDVAKERFAKYTQEIKNEIELVKGVAKIVNHFHGITIFGDDFDLLYSCYTGKNVIDNRGVPVFIKANTLRIMLADALGLQLSKFDEDVSADIRRLRKFWMPDVIKERCRRFKENVANRTEMINFNRAKINAVIEIMNTLHNRKTIVFNQSTQMVETLANQLPNSVPYHSQMESRYIYGNDGKPIIYKTGERKGEPKMFGVDTLRRLAIEGMRDGTYNTLVTSDCLNESLNIENIDLVITTAGTTNPTTYSQRNARGKRVDCYNPSKETIIINLYIDDFDLNGQIIERRDKIKLLMRQSNVNHTIVQVSDIKELIDMVL